MKRRTLNRGVKPIMERILALVCIDPDSGCWVFTGAAPTGYGQIRRGRRDEGKVLVHRATWEHYHGPIPTGLQVDHVKGRGCRHTRCCNPSHLEPVTPVINVRRSDGPAATKARAAAITHCRQGHPFDEANTVVTSGQRRCLICRRESGRRNYAKRRAA